MSRLGTRAPSAFETDTFKILVVYLTEIISHTRETIEQNYYTTCDQLAAFILAIETES